MVIYATCRTVYVTPDGERIKALRVKK
jgi:hypothetical protein